MQWGAPAAPQSPPGTVAEQCSVVEGAALLWALPHTDGTFLNWQKGGKKTQQIPKQDKFSLPNLQTESNILHSEQKDNVLIK